MSFNGSMRTFPSDQADRFREAARQVDADVSDDALDRAVGKLNLRAKPKPAPPPDEPPRIDQQPQPSTYLWAVVRQV